MAAATPYLVFRDGDGIEVRERLRGERTLTVGRDPSCDIALDWDDSVSRTHAILERLGRVWTIADDGISRNGTFVNAARITGRHRLVDGDAIRLGHTLIRYDDPQETPAGETNTQEPVLTSPLTRMQRRVLVALCRPILADPNHYATPATNAAIAHELVLSIEAVKTHLRSLFERFAVGDLPQNQKRAKVAEVALRTGIVSVRDL